TGAGVDAPVECLVRVGAFAAGNWFRVARKFVTGFRQAFRFYIPRKNETDIGAGAVKKAVLTIFGAERNFIGECQGNLHVVGVEILFMIDRVCSQGSDGVVVLVVLATL